MTDVQNQFIELAINHGTAIENGNHKIANKIHDKLTSLYNNEIKIKDKFLELEEIIEYDNESVKLWAATYLLSFNNCLAIKVLEKLQKSNKIFGLTASTTIDMWNKGMLQI